VNTSSRRASIKAHLLPFVDEVGEEMGCDDFSEVVCHLLNECRRYLRRNVLPGSAGLIQMPTPEQVRAVGTAERDEAEIASMLDGFLKPDD
jgi:hypothetical protein